MGIIGGGASARADDQLPRFKVHVLVTGASGLIGSALAAILAQRGDRVTPLVRDGRAAAGTPRWDPDAGTIDLDGLGGADAVVHLAGESIASGRWTAEKKRRILESRVNGTRLVAQAAAQLQPRPRALLSASAVGYYGDRGDEVLDESSAPGSTFLADVCQQWEEAAAPASEAGVRVAFLRFGVVLSRRGGALARMLTPFRLGLGGVLGSGRQYMSWVTLDDAVGAIAHLLRDDGPSGPVNVTAPTPVTNREFTKTLGRMLRRPTVLPMPATAARLAFGEMADELLLASARVLPRRLQERGYAFAHGELEPALRHVLRQ